VHVDVKKLGVIPPGGGHRILGKTLAARRHRSRGYDCIYVAVDDATRVAFVSVFPDQSATSAIQFAPGHTSLLRAAGRPRGADHDRPTSQLSGLQGLSGRAGLGTRIVPQIMESNLR
jgi:hypothetical protein